MLTLIDDSGHVSFAKAGINDLTRDLVGREASALRALAGSVGQVVQTPRLLGEVRYADTAFAVMTDVADGRNDGGLGPRQGSSRVLDAAMREIATIGSTYEREIRDSPWLARLRARADRLPPEKRPRTLDEALGFLSASTVRLPFGSWHGDWQPGNFLIRGPSVAVWDWERFESDVPLGFDAQHLALQYAVTVARTEPTVAAMHAVEGAPERLSSWQMASDQARLVAALHLLDLSVRYLHDGQGEAGADLGAVESWALPAATREIHRWTT